MSELENNQTTPKDQVLSEQALVLPLHDNNEAYAFNTPANLKEYIDCERASWSWLTEQNSHPQGKPISSHLKTQLVDVILNNLESVYTHWNSSNSDQLITEKNNLTHILEHIDFPFSNRIYGEEINKEKTISPIVATYILYLTTIPKSGNYVGSMIQIVQQLKTINVIHPNGRVTPIAKSFIETEPERLQANRILTKIELFGANIETKKLASHLKSVSNKINKIKNDSEESSKSYEIWKNEETEKFHTWKNVTENNFKEITKKIMRKVVSLKAKHTRKMSDLLRSSKETVSVAKDVYLSQVELAAAVTYWETKKNEHRQSKDTWLKVVIMLVLIAGSIPFLITKLLPAPDLTSKQLVLGIIDPTTLATTIIAISLLSFSIRLSSRQFSTQQHLYLEAEERKTMLKTYLALMNENKLVEQEDRKIALDALFRPAQTGMVADHGSVVPSDTIVKIIEKQSIGSRS